MSDIASNYPFDSSPIRLGAAPTVGRERELAQIRQFVRDAAQGLTRVLFLVGDAGIGKTRLLTHAMQSMRDAGGIAVLGRCLDERRGAPFVPWTDALTALDEQIRRRDPDGSASASDGLAHYLRGEAYGGSVIDAGGAEKRAVRQIVNLTRALGQTATAAPVLIAFDDLQWSDAASNQLLRYVSMALNVSPMALLGAYRTDDAARNRDLHRTLAEINRHGRSTTISVPPIAEDATHQLVVGLLGRPNPVLGSAIHRQSDGNPFIIEEIVRTVATDDELARSMVEPTWVPEPAGARAVIHRRTAALDPAARELLDIAALTGRTFSIDLVRRVSGDSPETLTHWFDSAVQAGLIEPVPDQPGHAYRFRHDQIRETIADAILLARKQDLHSRLATAVQESEQIEDRLERPALMLHHLVQAGASEQAAAVAEQLGTQAMDVHAFEQAAVMLSTALDLRRTGASGLSASHEAHLLLLRGDALLAASDPEAATVLMEAEKCASVANDRVLTGRAQLRRGRAHARREEHDRAVHALRSAVVSFADSDSQHREAVLAGVELATVLGTSIGAYGEAIEICERILGDVTERSVDPALEATVRHQLARTQIRSGQLVAGNAQLVPALGQALEAGAFDLAAEISGTLANHAYWTGRLDLSERWTRNRRDYAFQAGDPFAMRHFRSWLANIAIARGDWMTARRSIAEATEDVTPADGPEPVASLHQLSGIIALSIGQVDDAVSHFEQAMHGFRQTGQTVLPCRIALLAHAYQAAGHFDAAAEAVRETERIVATMPAGSLPLAPALAQLGLVSVLRQDVTGARRLYNLLLAYRGQLHWVLIDRVLGTLARTIGDQAAAAAHFADAESMALRGGVRPEHALAMAGQALDAVRETSNERTRTELEQAVARLRALGMEGAIRQLNILTSTRRSDAATGRPAGLTDRELAVLRLVAQGLSNREIGEQLHISETTVVNHLNHIYTKAGIDNRAEAFMFAVRHGLISGSD